MILTAIFRDGAHPKKVNFRTPDIFKEEERKNEIAKRLRERFGKIERKYKLEWRF